MKKSNHLIDLIDTTPQYYLIKVSSGSEKALVSSLIPNKVELTEEELKILFKSLTYLPYSSILWKVLNEKQDN